MKICFGIIFFLIISSSGVSASFLDDLLCTLNERTQHKNSESTIIAGLKEALSIGTENAVTNVSRINGYFLNQDIKILMPGEIRAVTDILGKAGFQNEVDDFILSMNRAAEKAAPQATTFFIGAIEEMSFDDATHILNGGDTAATDYFRQKTSIKLYGSFKPIVASSMEEAGVTNHYKQIIRKYESIPFAQKPSFDLDHYVTSNALDGLFYMVGEEEKKIRADPAARITDLLKTVFNK